MFQYSKLCYKSARNPEFLLIITGWGELGKVILQVSIAVFLEKICRAKMAQPPRKKSVRTPTPKIPLFLYLAHWLIQHVWATAQRVRKALNSFLMTQRQITLKDIMWLYNVGKLHRSRMSHAFLSPVHTCDFSDCWRIRL